MITFSIQVGPVQIVAFQRHLKHTGTYDNLQYPGWSCPDVAFQRHLLKHIRRHETFSIQVGPAQIVAFQRHLKHT
jgi:hypothetical protein